MVSMEHTSLIDIVRSRKSTERDGLVAIYSSLFLMGPKWSIASCNSLKFPALWSIMMKASSNRRRYNFTKSNLESTVSSW